MAKPSIYPPVQPGQRFGRLTVLYPDPTTSNGTANQRKWYCRCDCGTEKSFFEWNMQTETTKSCGCLSRELASQRATIHGFTAGGKLAPEFVAWCRMKQRTSNHQHQAYTYYGGRGIIVCDGWRNSFESFYKDMGPRPSAQHSIDRKENNLHYSCGKCSQCNERGWPANCRWATKEEQFNNRRSNHLLTFQGETLTIQQWSEKLPHLSYATIQQRINKLGWSIERTLATPMRILKLSVFRSQ